MSWRKVLTQHYVARLCEKALQNSSFVGDVLVLPVSYTHTNLTREVLGTAPVAGDSCCAALFSHLFLPKLLLFCLGEQS